MTTLTDKQKHWIRIIHAWSQSGLSQAEYCRHHHIDIKRFYSWKHVLDAKKVIPPDQGTFFPLSLVETSTISASAITVSLRDAEICFQHDTDETLFLRLLALLRRVA